VTGGRGLRGCGLTVYGQEAGEDHDRNECTAPDVDGGVHTHVDPGKAYPGHPQGGGHVDRERPVLGDDISAYKVVGTVEIEAQGVHGVGRRQAILLQQEGVLLEVLL